MGFSITGTIIAAVMLLPNIIFLFFPPQNVRAEETGAGRFFTIMEYIGQVALIALLVISHDSFDGRPFDVWAVLMAICIAVYYGLWLRYFLTGRQARLLYRPAARPAGTDGCVPGVRLCVLRRLGQLAFLTSRVCGFRARAYSNLPAQSKAL